MPLLAAGQTDVGQLRLTNQDAIYLNVDKRIFVVADGMGGHNGGDIASNMAVEEISQYLIQNEKEDPLTSIIHSVRSANTSIFNKSKENIRLKGMGTTVLSFYFKGPTLYIANVGDSRGYLINKKNIYQLSKDHSLVQEKINLGIYSRQEALLDPQKNILIRAVGFEDKTKIDVFTYKVIKNDIFILCSDGLYNKVNDHDIAYIINTCIPDPSQATQAQLDMAIKSLIGLSNMNGGQDNISAVIIVAK
jgi:PPM family protein phosphatase